MKHLALSLLCALLAFLLSAARINHGLVDSPLPPGPGLTLDESFNIDQGVYLCEAAGQHGPLLLTPTVSKRVFGSPDYLPDHPPLGRFLLGAAHQLTAWVIRGNDGGRLHVVAARLGSCLAFALTILLLVEYVRRRFDVATALLTAACLLLMPRVVGHARIAALETMTNLAWTAVLLALLVWWTKDRPPALRHSAFTGALWGLLMLTKVQGILLPPLVFAWAIWQHREKALLPLALFGACGAIVFFAGWPWLWLDPVDHTLRYLGRAAERPTLYVWYLGERFADKYVPWHFPFVMTATTVPLFALAAGGIRLLRREFTTDERLLIAAVVWPVIVFALPGTPVYDATRLFLPIMPAIAMLAARGMTSCWQSLRPESPRAAAPWRWAAVIVCLLAVPVVSRSLSPFALCDYNLLIGGPSGACTAGLESSYWADGLNGDFWDSIPENSTIYVAPVCHQFQLPDIEHLVPAFRRRNITLESFLYDPEKQTGLMLFIHRLADLRPSMREIPPGAQLISEVSYRGAVLVRLFDTSHADWTELPNWPGITQTPQ